jgi:hypothetical protein
VTVRTSSVGAVEDPPQRVCSLLLGALCAMAMAAFLHAAKLSSARLLCFRRAGHLLPSATHHLWALAAARVRPRLACSASSDRDGWLTSASPVRNAASRRKYSC